MINSRAEILTGFIKCRIVHLKKVAKKVKVASRLDLISLLLNLTDKVSLI